MTNYSTLGSNLKRGIFGFCKRISGGFFRPTQKFIFQMVFGLLAGQSCYLTEIGRNLNGKITLKKTVERLSRDLAEFDDHDELKEQYFK